VDAAELIEVIMTIDEIMKKPRHRMPKLGRVVEVDLDVLRAGIGSNYGVIHDLDTVVKRKVRRVMDVHGWRWQLAREHRDQELWDYCLEYDREQVTNLNYEFGLLK